MQVPNTSSDPRGSLELPALLGLNYHIGIALRRWR